MNTFWLHWQYTLYCTVYNISAVVQHPYLLKNSFLDSLTFEEFLRTILGTLTTCQKYGINITLFFLLDRSWLPGLNCCNLHLSLICAHFPSSSFHSFSFLAPFSNVLSSWNSNIENKLAFKINLNKFNNSFGKSNLEYIHIKYTMKKTSRLVWF